LRLAPAYLLLITGFPARGVSNSTSCFGSDKSCRTLFRTFLVSQGLFKTRVATSYLSNGKIIQNTCDDLKISSLRHVYNIIIDIYDNREEWEKDIWIFKNLGITPGRSDQKSINFTTINQPWLREATKQFCKYELVTKNLTPGTVIATSTSIKTLSKYLAKVHPDIQPFQLTRAIFENYLAFLLKEYPNNNNRLAILTKLNIFLTINELHTWLNLPSRLIYPGDYPKQNRNATVDSQVIPDIVIEQLLQHLSYFPLYQQRMLILLANGGMRISELTGLPFDCLISDGSGGYLLRYYQPKMKESLTKPIASIFHKSAEVIEVIKEQQKEVKTKFGNQCPYLFPSEQSKLNHIRPVAYGTICNTLKRVACTHNIVDENGRFWNFHPHQFRHTVGTKLANDDEVGLFGTKTYLGHASINMTLHYAKMDEKKLQKKIDKFNNNNQIIDYTGKRVNLDKEERFNEYWNYIKQGDLLKAQIMEHGICTLPAVLSPCPHKHKCLSCTHFVTTPEHLPFHINEYKIQLARKQVAEARGMQRSIEEYNNTLGQLEKIIIQCGGDLEVIKAGLISQDVNLDLQSAQIYQLMTKLGLSTIEELLQILLNLKEAYNE
jgi:integrase/recombinase XerD